MPHKTLELLRDEIELELLAAETMVTDFIEHRGVPFRETLLAQAVVNVKAARAKLGALGKNGS